MDKVNNFIEGPFKAVNTVELIQGCDLDWVPEERYQGHLVGPDNISGKIVYKASYLTLAHAKQMASDWNRRYKERQEEV